MIAPHLEHLSTSSGPNSGLAIVHSKTRNTGLAERRRELLVAFEVHGHRLYRIHPTGRPRRTFQVDDCRDWSEAGSE